MNRDTNRKMEMLSVALQNGAVDWAYDDENGILYAYPSDEIVDSGGPIRTDYWIDKTDDDDGEWLFCIDRWNDGDVITSVAKLFPFWG